MFYLLKNSYSNTGSVSLDMKQVNFHVFRMGLLSSQAISRSEMQECHLKSGNRLDGIGSCSMCSPDVILKMVGVTSMLTGNEKYGKNGKKWLYIKFMNIHGPYQ